MSALIAPTYEPIKDPPDVYQVDDTWQQVGAVVRPLIRKLGLPLPTARLVLERAGIRAIGGDQ
jgi:hypothetical protein